MTLGTVLRSHAGGYLVFEPRLNISLQCQARKRLKKERISILTGDRVVLEDVDIDAGTAVITGCKGRSSLLSRPPIANVDQVIIVQAVRQPEWNQLWCDRYIVHFQLELPGSKPILCFNKCDLVDAAEHAALRAIYEPLGYRVLLLSAKTGMGIDELESVLPGHITVFAGPSGVGKSSLLNSLEPSLNLKIGVMDHDFGVGRHTTTYSKIYQVLEKRGGEAAWVADTPGFNLAELRHPDPADVMWQFPEIVKLMRECRFSNCMHLVETGCRVLECLPPQDEDEDDSWDEGHSEVTDDHEVSQTNGAEQQSNSNGSIDTPGATGSANGTTNGSANGAEHGYSPESEHGYSPESELTNHASGAGGDDTENGAADESNHSVTDEDMTPNPESEEILISVVRYTSYVTMVSEAQEVFNQRRDESSKVETGVKRVGGDKGKGKAKYIPLLSGKYRQASRRSEKQRLTNSMILDDDLEEQIDEPIDELNGLDKTSS